MGPFRGALQRKNQYIGSLGSGNKAVMSVTMQLLSMYRHFDVCKVQKGTDHGMATEKTRR